MQFRLPRAAADGLDEWQVLDLERAMACRRLHPENAAMDCASETLPGDQDGQRVEGGQLIGRLFGPDGEPESGAVVGLFGPTSESTGAPCARSTTDEEGRFSFKTTGSATLLGTAPVAGCIPRWIELPQDGQTTGLRIHLARGQACTIEVLDSSGSPAEEALVYVLDRDGYGEKQASFAATGVTGSGGRVELLCPEHVHLLATSAGGEAALLYNLDLSLEAQPLTLVLSVPRSSSK